MSPKVLPPEVVRKRKMLFLFCGVLILFITSMAKVLVPATIFEDLQRMGMDVDRISSLGAAFLYSYAASQLLIGCFSDRYGGVRVLLIGGSLFVTGTIIFPLLENYYLMILFRCLTGFGAGTIFLGVAKLLADLFSAKFAMALGVVLMFSYFGPTAGTVPMVKLVEAIGWRWAMILPGAVACVPLMTIILFAKGTIIPVKRGQTLMPLLVMLRSRNLWFLCFGCATVYGAYYALVGQIGQKIFTDLYGLEPGRGALCMMILTILVAVNNIVGNLLLKLFGNRRKMVILTGVAVSFAGILLARYGFYAGCGWGLFMTSAVLIAFPAGFFPLFSTVAKELFSNRYTAMAVAFLNFMAFVFISAYQNIAGVILKKYPTDAVTLAFPVTAYEAVYHFFIAGAVVSLIAALLAPETKDRVRE